MIFFFSNKTNIFAIEQIFLYLCAENVVMEIFGLNISRKSKEQEVSPAPVLSEPKPAPQKVEITDAGRFLECFTPALCHRNYAFLFHNIAEVQFPIMYIARRAANAQYVLRKASDDSVVWADSARGTRDRYVAGIIEKGLLQSPNPYMTFKEFVVNSLISKLLFGNLYTYAYTDRNSGRLWETCRTFYVLPPTAVQVSQTYRSVFGTLEGVTYRYSDGSATRTIPQELILHIHDLPTFTPTREGQLVGRSRLDAQKYPVSNICAVYEARNAIYVKRGALGLVVNQKRDADGTTAMTPGEKEKILDDFQKTYGVVGGKAPIAITQVPVSYIPIGMSIAALQPFEECLLDAAAIAGAYGVDSNLIPRKDNPTFNNLNTAELNVYNSVVMPEVKSWLDGFNRFLGLYDAGYYIDALWDDVAILQDNAQRRENAKASTSARCEKEFKAGIITLNDWRAAIGRERLKGGIYNKTLLEMSWQEIQQINTIKGI